MPSVKLVEVDYGMGVVYQAGLGPLVPVKGILNASPYTDTEKCCDQLCGNCD